MPVKKQRGREQTAGLIILSSLLILTLSTIGVHLIDANVTNMELVDHDLYTVITDKGTTNVAPGDVLRIERTYTKAAVTGKPVELDKIYTKQGFIYISSLDPYAKAAHELIESVDYYGKQVWERPDYAGTKAVQRYAYAMGTPDPWIPVLTFLVSCQSFVLAVGGVTLFAMIFPFSWSTVINKPTKLTVPGEIDYCSDDEQLGAVAK